MKAILPLAYAIAGGYVAYKLVQSFKSSAASPVLNPNPMPLGELGRFRIRTPYQEVKRAIKVTVPAPIREKLRTAAMVAAIPMAPGLAVRLVKERSLPGMHKKSSGGGAAQAPAAGNASVIDYTNPPQVSVENSGSAESNPQPPIVWNAAPSTPGQSYSDSVVSAYGPSGTPQTSDNAVEPTQAPVATNEDPAPAPASSGGGAGILMAALATGAYFLVKK